MPCPVLPRPRARATAPAETSPNSQASATASGRRIRVSAAPAPALALRWLQWHLAHQALSRSQSSLHAASSDVQAQPQHLPGCHLYSADESIMDVRHSESTCTSSAGSCTFPQVGAEPHSSEVLTSECRVDMPVASSESGIHCFEGHRRVVLPRTQAYHRHLHRPSDTYEGCSDIDDLRLRR